LLCFCQTGPTFSVPRHILNQEKSVSVIAWIIVGLIAGWLATQILGGRCGLLYNLAVGLVGAIVGGFLFEKLRLEVVPDFWGNLITATIGAVVFLLIWRAIRRP
jgi:uncharacterized membrane protein YeaQ/YmgE (transglycosylase-associated protein family)